MRARTSIDSQRLLIVQPYVPAYRVPLFAKMRVELLEHGITLAVASSKADGHDGARGDDSTAESADFLLNQRRMRLRNKTLLLRQVGSVIESFRPGFVIVEQAIKNLESWPLLLEQRRTCRPSVAMWGQGRSYSVDQSDAVALTKQWLTRHADWFFSYTQSGADYVASHGFPRDRTTVLWNSTDTDALRADLRDLSTSDVDVYRSALGLTPGRTALFLGGVDERKGIPFLLSAAREVASQLPGFVLLVGGSGALGSVVEQAERSGEPIRLLGRVDGREKSLALAASDVLMIPEWIGLVAVDSLASRTPIISTHHPSHSPEVEYLKDGVSAIFTDHTVRAYSSAVVNVLREPQKLDALRMECDNSLSGLSIDAMVGNFVSGALNWMSHAR